MYGTSVHITCIMLNLTLAFMVCLRTNASTLHVKLSNRAFKLTSPWTLYIFFFNYDDSRLSELKSHCWELSANLSKRSQVSGVLLPINDPPLMDSARLRFESFSPLNKYWTNYHFSKLWCRHLIWRSLNFSHDSWNFSLSFCLKVEISNLYWFV